MPRLQSIPNGEAKEPETMEDWTDLGRSSKLLRRCEVAPDEVWDVVAMLLVYLEDRRCP